MSLYESLTRVLAPFAEKIKGIQTGYDGTTYSSPGEAVRTQISDLHVLIGDEPGTAIQGGSVSYDGTESGLTATTVQAAIDENAANVSSTNERLSDITPSVYKTAISSIYSSTANNYYRILDTEPSTSKSYAVKITCATSGNHTFQIGIAGSASSMRDTLGTFNMTANEPMMIYGYTPSGAGYKYVRNTVGDEWDVKFCDVYEDLADDAVNASTEVSNLSASVNVLNGKFTQSIGKNRFSGQNLSTGYYNTQGSIIANSDWTLSDYTDVEGFDNVTFSSTINGTRVLFSLSYIAFFDSEKGFIEQINSATSVEIPETAKYIRFSWRTAPVDLQVENGTTFSEYEPYTVFNEIVNSLYIKETVKPYSEIRWAVFGDSMTEKNAKATFSYYDYVREDLGCSVVNYGASGTGYKAREGENLAFYQRMLTVDPDDFDVLTIFGSVNDAGQTVGNITDTGTTTLCGCINTTIDNFYSVAPFKTIGLVTPPPTRSLNYTAQDTTWIDAYVEAIIGIAKRRSIPVMDMYHESGLRPYNEDFKVEYYNENGSQDVGVHPNSKAHKQFLYPKFRQFFKKLI